MKHTQKNDRPSKFNLVLFQREKFTLVTDSPEQVSSGSWNLEKRL